MYTAERRDVLGFASLTLTNSILRVLGCKAPSPLEAVFGHYLIKEMLILWCVFHWLCTSGREYKKHTPSIVRWILSVRINTSPIFYEIMIHILDGRPSGTSQERSWGLARLRGSRPDQNSTTSSILLWSILVRNEHNLSITLFVIWQTLQNSWHATFHWYILWKSFEVGAVPFQWIQ